MKRPLKQSLVLPALLAALGCTTLISFYNSRQYWSLSSSSSSLTLSHEEQQRLHNPVRQALLGFESSYSPRDRAIEEHSPKHEQPQPLQTTIPPPPRQLERTGKAQPQPQAQRPETKAELIARLYPNETALPNPQPVADGNSTFAACLLVMDDNHRLTEWLAYHYHILPLRYLVIAVDERSQTTPTHILNQWRRHGMTIIEWTDADFWRRKDGSLLQPMPDDAAFQQKRDRHRGRQKYFYKQCLLHMKRAQRTWVSLHDSDEYLVYNQNLVHESPVAAQIPTPSTAEAGAMIRYINQQRDAGEPYFAKTPCLGVPRLFFGADPARIDAKTVMRNVPPVLVGGGGDAKSRDNLAMAMDTLVYRHHAPRDDFVKNALGKVLMDVSRIDVAAAPYFMSLHRPIKTICPAPWHKDAEAGLRIHHYLGSWDSYSFRDDARRGGERSWEQWEYKATTVSNHPDADSDDVIRPWVSGLVDTHGANVALDMLEHVGLPPTYHNANDEAWHLLPEKLAAILKSPVSTSQDNKAVAFEDWVRQKYLTASSKLAVTTVTMADS
jgi:Glycosyl transferase family 2